jgi:hypothetical protein
MQPSYEALEGPEGKVEVLSLSKSERTRILSRIVAVESALDAGCDGTEQSVKGVFGCRCLQLRMTNLRPPGSFGFV